MPSKQNNTKTSLKSLVNDVKNHKFNLETCFLCGESLQISGGTVEHIFPKWLQNRFNLWDQHLELLNNSSIQYRYLTIPCCEECNRYQLQPIETIIANAFEKGVKSVRALGDKILYLWLSKIFYGILYKEALIATDRKSIDSPRIVPLAMIKEYEHHLFLLQEMRNKIQTEGFCPGSIFVFNAQKPQAIELQWDFTDNVDTLFIAIRMGDVAIFGCLGDGGAQKENHALYDDLLDLPLHPLQFRELCARISYLSTLMNRTPKQITISGEPHKVFQLPLGGYWMKPYFNEWDFDTYAKFLAIHTGFNLSKIRPNSRHILSLLYDPEGKPLYRSFEKESFEYFYK